ncbi:hypothetical protein MTO96_031665 [Rhipicephalus appendiculatus]
MAYLDVLCSLLSSMPCFTLPLLDDEADLNLPKVRGHSVHDAVSAIRACLASAPCQRSGLQSVAHIYCFLAEQRALQPWVLYRLDQSGNQADRVAGVLNTVRGRCEVGSYTKRTPSFSCTCLLTPDEVGCMVYIPHIFCIWPSYPCVAVHQPPPGYSSLGAGALWQILGGPPDSFCCGIYRDLNEAFRAAKQLKP